MIPAGVRLTPDPGEEGGDPLNYRILLTGSRNWDDVKIVDRCLSRAVKRATGPVVLVQGGAPGVDELGRMWARAHGVSLETHHAETFGPWPACGPLRNRHMVSLGADLCLALIKRCVLMRCVVDRRLHGTHGASRCADMAEKAGIPTFRYEPWKDTKKT